MQGGAEPSSPGPTALSREASYAAAADQQMMWSSCMLLQAAMLRPPAASPAATAPPPSAEPTAPSPTPAWPDAATLAVTALRRHSAASALVPAQRPLWNEGAAGSGGTLWHTLPVRSSSEIASAL